MRRRPVTSIILAGGAGTRLRPLTLARAKPVIPVANVPMIFHLLDRLADAGIRRSIITLSYRPEDVRRVVGASCRGMEVLYNIESEPMGTGGALAQVAELVEGDALVVNGDIICGLDAALFMSRHYADGWDATLLAVPVDDPSRYGVIEFQGDGSVQAFVEKPPPGQASSRWINGGMYLLSGEIVRSIPADRPVSIEREVFPELLERGERISAFRYEGYWMDIGTIESYRRAHADLLGGLWEWSRPVPGRIDVGAESFCEEGSIVGRGATIRRSIIWRGCRVGEGAEVTDCVLADGTNVPAGACLAGRISGPGMVAGDSAGKEE